MKILYRGTLNAFSKVNEAGLTQDNRANAQALANTTLSSSTSRGILNGSVVAVIGAGVIGKATTASTGIVGLAVNDAAGYPYESASAAGSGKVTYVHGSQTLVAVSIYETATFADAAVAINYSTAAGLPVYASQNGLLTIASGVDAALIADATIVGIVVEPPTATNPLLVVQSRI